MYAYPILRGCARAQFRKPRPSLCLKAYNLRSLQGQLPVEEPLQLVEWDLCILMNPVNMYAGTCSNTDPTRQGNVEPGNAKQAAVKIASCDYASWATCICFTTGLYSVAMMHA